MAFDVRWDKLHATKQPFFRTQMARQLLLLFWLIYGMLYDLTSRKDSREQSLCKNYSQRPQVLATAGKRAAE